MPALPTERFAAVGHCIYCRSTSDLTDEHIIPAALDGNWVLPSSSCVTCARITSGFESQYINSIRVLRSGLALGSKRRKTKPRTASLDVVLPDREATVSLPLTSHPLAIGLPVFLEPRCLRLGAAPDAFKPTKVQVISYGKLEGARLLGAKAIKFNMSVPHFAFGRMLAKIAYAYIVAQFGQPALSEVLVLPAINGESTDVGQWVGCYRAMEERAADADSLHRMNLAMLDFLDEKGKLVRVVMARIQLFCNSPSPGYVVVVARVHDEAQLAPQREFNDSSPWPIRGDLPSLRGTA